MLEQFFRLRDHKTTVGTELMAGLTTYMVMAYIIFVNPSILGLGGQGLPRPATTTATCLVAGVMSIAMGLYTNRAYALAPGLGLNGVVAFQLVGQQGLSFPQAMGVVVLEGLLITLLVLFGVRKVVFDAVPLHLKQAIAVGIGWFILFIGLVDAGIVRKAAPLENPVPLEMGQFTGVPILVAMIGLTVMVVMMALRVRGALLWGILIATAASILLNAINGGSVKFSAPGVAVLPTQIVAAPDFSTIGHVDFSAFGKIGVLATVLAVVTLSLADFFDMMGTLVGVGTLAGYVNDKGELPHVQKPLLVDALAAVVGGAASASSATTYIESAAGVGVGGRTGLMPIVTGILFLLSMPFWPLISIVPAEATAPALILVGFLMMGVLSRWEGDATGTGGRPGIDFTDLEQGLPAVMTMVIMPLTYNITNGIGAGFVTYALIKLVKRDWSGVHPAVWGIAGLFLLYFLRTQLFGVSF